MPSHYLHQCRFISHSTLTNFSEIWTFILKIKHLEMSSVKWQPFCLSLNVLTHCPPVIQLGFSDDSTKPSPEPILTHHQKIRVTHPSAFLIRAYKFLWIYIFQKDSYPSKWQRVDDTTYHLCQRSTINVHKVWQWISIGPLKIHSVTQEEWAKLQKSQTCC